MQHIALSGLDIFYLLKEIKPLLADAFIDKIYQGGPEKSDFLFRMRSPQSGKQQLYIKIPEAVFLTEHRYEWPMHPPGFCMQLRKVLMNSKLIDVEQRGLERIITLTFIKGETKWLLILELFGKGNVILVTEENKIRGVLNRHHYKDREVQVNADFVHPPATIDPTKITKEELINLFKQTGKDVVKFCATALSLGGRYAEELVARAQLDKSVNELSDVEFTRLYDALRQLFDEPLAPAETEKTILPIVMVTNPKSDPIDSFSQGVEKTIVTQKVSAAESSHTQSKNKVLDKWQAIIDQQSRSVKGYEKSGNENQRKGEIIYEKYGELSGLLEKVNQLREKGGFLAVKEFIKENKLPISVDEKNQKIVLELKED